MSRWLRVNLTSRIASSTEWLSKRQVLVRGRLSVGFLTGGRQVEEEVQTPFKELVSQVSLERGAACASALVEFADKGASELQQVHGLSEEGLLHTAQLFNPELNIQESRVFLSDPVVRLKGFRIAGQRF